MVKERLIYIDTVKGIAMFFVILFHVARFLDLYYPDYHNHYIVYLRDFDTVYNQFFLAVFFVVSGYFYRVKKFGSFLMTNIRTLLLPIFFIGIILNVCYDVPKLSVESTIQYLIGSFTTPSKWLHFFGNWFLGALFWARIIIYPIYRYINEERLQWGILVGLSFLGFVADIDILNYMWIRQGLLFAIYLKIGQWFYTTNKIEDNMLYKNLAIIFYPLALVVVLLLGIAIKPIGWTIEASWWNYLIYLILSVSGSFMLVLICKKYDRKKMGLIEYIGRNTLIFYIINGAITKNAIKLVFKLIPNENDLLMTISFVLAILLCNIIAGCIMSYIINTKYLRFIIGR